MLPPPPRLGFQATAGGNGRDRVEMAKRGRASCCPDCGHWCLKEEEELAAFAIDGQAPHFFPVILTFQCILIPMYHGGSRWFFLDPHPKASLSLESLPHLCRWRPLSGGSATYRFIMPSPRGTDVLSRLPYGNWSKECLKTNPGRESASDVGWVSWRRRER